MTSRPQSSVCLRTGQRDSNSFRILLRCCKYFSFNYPPFDFFLSFDGEKTNGNAKSFPYLSCLLLSVKGCRRQCTLPLTGRAFPFTLLRRKTKDQFAFGIFSSTSGLTVPMISPSDIQVKLSARIYLNPCSSSPVLQSISSSRTSETT